MHGEYEETLVDSTSVFISCYLTISNTAVPKAWNALPAELQDLTDHSAFKRQLKTFLFECAFTT